MNQPGECCRLFACLAAGFILVLADSLLLGGVSLPTLLWETWVDNSSPLLLELALSVAES